VDEDVASLTMDSEINWKFVRLASVDVDANIHELQFINENRFLFATGKGDLIVAKWYPDERKLRPTHQFPNIHGAGETCVAFSLFGNDVVSLGSNCTLKRLNVDAAAPSGRHNEVINAVRDEGKVGFYSSKVGSLLCIEHFGVNEIVTGNAVGQLQLWDLRQDLKTPLKHVASLIHDSGAVTAVRSQPSQRHIVGAGYQTGKLAFWDLRNVAIPLTSSALDVHNGPIWELAFDPQYPSHLFSAGNDGRLFYWNASSVKLIGERFSISPWSLPSDELHEQLKVTNLLPQNTMPINSLDIAGGAVLAGIDNEAVWMIRNVTSA